MSRRAVVLLVFALALAGLLLAVWQATHSDESVVAPNVPSARESPRAETSTPEVLARPTKSNDDRERTTAANSERGDDDARWTKPESEMLALRVVDEASAAPVADAELQWIDFDSDPTLASRQAALDFAGIDAALAARGHHFRSDAAGETHVPRVKDRALVTAAKGDAWGRIEYLREAKALVLVITRDATVLARVLDANGAVVEGAPVRIFSPDWPESLRARTEPSTGIARFPHALVWMKYNPQLTFQLGVDALVSQPVHAALDPRSLSSEPIALRLPPTGSVEVRVHSRRPVAQGVEVELVNLVGTQDGPVPSRENGGIVAARTFDGAASFPLVGLGLALEARTDAHGDALADGVIRGNGPRTAGEHIVLELGARGASRAIAARAVDESAKPIVSTELAVQFERWTDDSDRASSALAITTDEHGEFQLELGSGWTAAMHAHVALGLAGGDEASSPRGAIDLAGPYPEGRTSLGDVVFYAPRAVASGRVVDELGQPFAGASVQLFILEPDNSDPSGASWTSTSILARSGADGTFQLFGDVGNQSLRVSASADSTTGMASSDIVHAGARDLELKLTRSASLEGKVRVDPEFSVRELVVRCTPQVDPARGTAAQPVQTACQQLADSSVGRFEFQGLAPGRARVEIATLGAVVLESFDQVELRGGEVCKDPRLAEIDLRGRVHAFAIQVVDSRGLPVQSAVLHSRASGTQANWASWYVQSGDARIVEAASAIDISIDVGGYLPQLLTNLQGDARIVLRDGFGVTLVLKGDCIVPSGSSSLSCSLLPLEPDHETKLWPSSVRAKFEVDGRARVSIGAAGRYRVAFMVDVELPGGTERHPVQVLHDVVIQVASSDAAQTIEVPLSQAELATANVGH